MTPACPDFLSCDWGTTSFRLRWVSGAEGRIVREVCEPTGIKALYDEASRDGARTEADRAKTFSRFLRSKLDALATNTEPPQHGLPLVISGMASSSVGWRELAYADVPFPLDGRGLSSAELAWDKPPWLGPTFLISGIASQHDVMRGEETEIIGLMSEPALAALRKRALLILPGTHSKHVWIKNDSVVDFRTFMTGELFDVLGRHSLLRASVAIETRSAAESLAPSDRAAFQEGVRWAIERGLAGGLFRVRTRAVLDRRALSDNTWFFSGMLVGAELQGIGENCDRPVILGAARSLSEVYGLALEVVARGTREWIRIPPEQVEHATIAAHSIFLKNTRSVP